MSIDPGPEPSMDEVAVDARRRTFNPTELGNAERFVARHGTDVKYVYKWARWLHWTGTRWQPDESGEAERRLKDTLRQLLADAHEIDNDKERKDLVKHVIASERAGSVRGALELARSEPGIPVDPGSFDTDPMLFNVLNGTISLATGKLRPHDRADLLTKISPVSFNPDATAPRWHSFLETIIPDSELRDWVQRFAGYSLTGSTVEQKMAIFWGGGANGKSTYVEALRFVLGDYGQQAPAETFLERRETIPNDVARLRGARLVVATELTEGRRLNEALVKRMTGGDTMVARFMRAEWFEFEMQAKIIIGTNHRPVISGTDEAIWRRVKLVPFSVTIPKAEWDLQLGDKLRAEAAGILNWCLAGCLAWQRDGLGEAFAITAATTTYRDESDTLGAFLADCCDLDPSALVKASELYTRYGYWANANGIDPVKQQTFGLRLTDRGFTKARTEKARMWKGLSLTTTEGMTHDAS